MNYWLLKSEPNNYSWEQLMKDKKTVWSGVRNYAARNNLKLMKKGELVLFYHSNIGVEIVGLAEISKEFYPDPTIQDDRWVAVDIKPFKKLHRPISLTEIKSDPMLQEMTLVKISRLSVQPVTLNEFVHILHLSNSLLRK
ncbi:MAG: EVE domain-containing protein [Sediminibacterium sp.]|nr:EVE domain-containing protein [Sediminibacterium sp.]